MAKQPQKRRTSFAREETAAKRQLCEEALYQNDLVNSFEYEINIKEVQTELQCNSVYSMTSPEVASVSTQVLHIHLTIMSLSVISNRSTALIRLKNLSLIMKAAMKVNTTKVKANMTIIVLQMPIVILL